MEYKESESNSSYGKESGVGMKWLRCPVYIEMGQIGWYGCNACYMHGPQGTKKDIRWPLPGLYSWNLLNKCDNEEKIGYK